MYALQTLTNVCNVTCVQVEEEPEEEPEEAAEEDDGEEIDAEEDDTEKDTVSFCLPCTRYLSSTDRPEGSLACC